MFCPHCGTNLPNGTRFCPNCGAPTQPQTPPPNNGYGYRPNPGYPPPPSTPIPPIPYRSIAMAVILTIITCGFYGIYWVISLVNELNQASGRTADQSGGMVFLLGLVTCGIYWFVWLYQAGEKVQAVRIRATGYPGDNSGIVYLILSLLGFSIVSFALLQYELNKVASF